MNHDMIGVNNFFVLKKKIGTDDENGVYAPKLGPNWLNFYEKMSA